MREKRIVELVRRAVRGAGGKDSGGGSTRAPVEAPDSLRSIQYARVLDLISEGEIGGLVNGAQSVYLDDTPLQNADGTFNFSGVTLQTTVGTQAQSYLPGFPAIESENAVNAEVTFAGSVTRQISNVNVNTVRVTIAIPQLTSQNSSTGDLSGTSVQIAIDLQANGGGFVEQTLPDGGVIAGKTTTRYPREYSIALTGSAPWDIRIRRITADSGSAALVNKTYWSSYTEIIDAKLTFPNSAVNGLEIDASQFSAVPVRSYDEYGWLLQVPSNYDPATRTYTGTWDGTFQTAWADNPAWAYYTIVTHERAGLGDYVDAAGINKWALYDIGVYCDELVDDGFGGQEPRFTCNLYLQTREEAYKVLANMASIFRGMAYWGAGNITAVADMPSDPVALYTAANVLGGQFSYQGTARNTRHTVALVSWNDPEDGYRLKVEYVEDLAGIERYGVVQTEVVAFGCASRGQAHRLGRWILYSERLETETVTFGAGLDAVLCAPGDVITTHDPMRAGVRFGGRIISAAGTAITLDAPVTLTAATTYTLSAMLPDGTIEDRTVTTSASTTASLTIAAAFTSDPQAMAIWVLRSAALVPETWRVLAVTESEKAQFQIVGLKHNPDKFDAVENNLLLEPAQTTTLNSRPDGVTNLTGSESLFEISAGVVSDRLTLSWSGVTGRYRVSYRGSVGNWVVLPETISQTVDIDGLEPDIYTFSVVQLNSLGRASAANTLTQQLYGKTAAPSDPTGFAVQSYAGQAKFTVDESPDLDVKVGGRWWVRWSPLTSLATWINGSLVNPEGYPGDTAIGFGPLMTGTYMCKWMDSSSNYCANEASFVVTEALLTGLSTLATVTESPDFTGTKVNTFVSGGGLQLTGSVNWDDMPGNIDDWGLIDYAGGVSPTGSYSFASKMDLGSVKTSRLFGAITSLAFDTGDVWDDRADNIDDWGLIDGSVIEDAEATLMVRTTNDDPNGSPTWGPWHALGLVGDYVARGFDFRLDFASGTVTHNRLVTALSVTAKQ